MVTIPMSWRSSCLSCRRPPRPSRAMRIFPPWHIDKWEAVDDRVRGGKSVSELCQRTGEAGVWFSGTLGRDPTHFRQLMSILLTLSISLQTSPLLEGPDLRPSASDSVKGRYTCQPHSTQEFISNWRPVQVPSMLPMISL